MNKKESYYGIDVSLAADFTSFVDKPIIMQVGDLGREGKPIFALDIMALVTRYNIPLSIFRDKRYRLVVNPTLCISPNDMLLYPRGSLGSRVARVVRDKSKKQNPFFKQMVKCRQLDESMMQRKKPKERAAIKYDFAAPKVHDLVINAAGSREYESRSMLAEQLGGMIGKWTYDIFETKSFDEEASNFKSPFANLVDNMKRNNLTVGYKAQKYIGEAYKSKSSYKREEDDYNIDTEEERDVQEAKAEPMVPFRQTSNELRYNNQDGIDIIITPIIIVSWLSTSMYCESTMYGIEQLENFTNSNFKYEGIDYPVFTMDFHQRHLLRASMIVDDAVNPTAYKEESEDDALWSVLYTSMGDSANVESINRITTTPRPELEDVANKFVRRRQAGYYVNMDQILFPFKGTLTPGKSDKHNISLYTEDEMDAIASVGRRLDMGDLNSVAKGLTYMTLWYELYTIFSKRWDAWISKLTAEGWPGGSALSQLAASKNNEISLVSYAFGRWNDEQTTVRWQTGDINSRTAMIGADLVRWTTDIGMFGVSGHNVISNVLPPHNLWSLIHTTVGYIKGSGARQKMQVTDVLHHSGRTTRRLRRMTNFKSGRKEIFMDDEIVNPDNFYKKYK